MGEQRKEILERNREQGSALVLVIILIVGILGMLSFLFALGQSNTKSQAESREHLDVDMALRSAMADAASEVSNSVDLTNGGGTLDGLGAKGTLLVVGTDTSANHGAAYHQNYGIPLEVSSDSTNNFYGRTLARYMTTIDTSGLPNRLTMNVVAAYPNFAIPKIVKGAKVAFRPSLVFADRNAVTFAGGMNAAGGGKFGIYNSHDCNLQIDEPSDTYPAINVSNSALASNTNFVGFINDITALGGYSGISGLAGTSPYTELADPSLGDGSGSGWDTITGYPSANVQFNETVLTAIANDWRSFYENAASTTVLTGNTGGGKTYTTAHPLGNPMVLSGSNTNDPATETFHVFDDTANLEGVSIVGSGTLVMDNNTLTFKDGASLRWDGNVIIYGDGSPSTALHIEHGDVEITGKLILVADPAQTKRSDLKMKGSSGTTEADGICRLKVDGSIMAIAAGSAQSEIHLTSKDNQEAPRLEVQGIFMTLGDSIDFDIQGSNGAGSPHLEYPGIPGSDPFGAGTNGSEHMTHFKVQGSMILAGPAGSTMQKFGFGKHLHTRLIYDNANYEAALTGIQEVSPSISTWVQEGYYELGADQVNDESARKLLSDMLNDVDTASATSPYYLGVQ